MSEWDRGLRPKYKMLQADMVSGKDRELASAVSSFVLSGNDAYKLAGHDNFSYQVLDSKGRCGVVLYKGIEIALLFKREVLEREPWPAEPVPVAVLKEPADAWLRIDLLGATPVEQLKGISETLRKAMEANERLRLLWQDADSECKRLADAAKVWQEEKKELKILREKVALMSREKGVLT